MSAAPIESAAPTAVARRPRPRPGEQAAPVMTPTQVRTFNELLAIGGPRPTMHPELPQQLEEKISSALAEVLPRWTEPSVWLTKSTLFTVLRCEGQLTVEPDTGVGRKTMHPATVVGIVAHQAIQIAHTHPGRHVAAYVQYALESALQDESIAEFWASTPVGAQSDLRMQMVSRVTAFLDSWPALEPLWEPRFEEKIQAKVGRLTLSARADLVLGRPRAAGRQTMLLCDLKSGTLHEDDHFDEAMFYALVSTLRHGVAPFRSTVYSLASGTYTDPDVTAERLHTATDKLITAVSAMVDVRTEVRAPVLTPGRYCGWCALRATCPQAEAGAVGEPRRGGEPVALPAPSARAVPPAEDLVVDDEPAAARPEMALGGYDEPVPPPPEGPDPFEIDT